MTCRSKVHSCNIWQHVSRFRGDSCAIKRLASRWRGQATAIKPIISVPKSRSSVCNLFTSGCTRCFECLRDVLTWAEASRRGKLLTVVPRRRGRTVKCSSTQRQPVGTDIKLTAIFHLFVHHTPPFDADASIIFSQIRRNQLSFVRCLHRQSLVEQWRWFLTVIFVRCWPCTASLRSRVKREGHSRDS